MITNALLEKLRHILTSDYLVTDEATCALYGGDRSGRYNLPGAVLLPGSEEEVARTLRALVHAGVSVAVRGAGTGVAGGAAPDEGGIVLSLSRLNGPVTVKTEEMVATAPAGARLAEVEREARRHGLRFGSPLAEYGRGLVGSAVARNGDGLGGPTGMLSGAVRGLRAVTASGEVLVAEMDGPWGRNTHGAGLLIGSEGALGVITGATFALERRMPAERLILASFKNPIVAAEAGRTIVMAGHSPLLADVVDLVSWRRAGRWPASESAEGLLLVWLSGLETDVEDETKWAIDICQNHFAHTADVLSDRKTRDIADSWGRVVRLSRPRQGQIPLDFSVPVAALPDLLRTVYDEASRLSLPLVGIGRIMSGTLAMHIPLAAEDDGSADAVREFIERTDETTQDMEGTSLALHGVGANRLQAMAALHRENNLDAMRAIKSVFDGRHLLGLTVTPERSGERRDFRRRNRLEPKIAEVRERITEQIELVNTTGESLQINASSATVLSHTMRVARTERIPVSIHEQPPHRSIDIWLSGMNQVALFDPNSRLLAIEAGATLGEIEEKVAPAGLWWPVSPFISKRIPLSDLLAWEQAGAYSLRWGRLRNRVIGLEAVTGKGDIISWGGVVLEHHAGLPLAELCLGARNRYAVITAAALSLTPLPSARATVSALFEDLNSAEAAVRRWLGHVGEGEAPKCRPAALCILAASGSIGEYSDRVTAFVEFAGIPSSVERQVRWAKHIADQNKGVDVFEGIGDEASDMWSSLADVYRPVPPAEGGNTLHLVVWMNAADWLILTRMIRHIVHAHGHPCRLLTDVGAGRMDVLVEGAAVEPAPLLRVLSEVVLKVGALMEVRSSAFAWQWVGNSSAPLEELSDGLKRWFDPSGILPVGLGKPFESAMPGEAEAETEATTAPKAAERQKPMRT